MTDAVFVFDVNGDLCAKSAQSSAAAGWSFATLDGLAKRFRSADGTPLDLMMPGTRIGFGVNGHAGLRVAITTEALDGEGAAERAGRPATVVSIHSVAGEDDPTTLRFALGSILAHELRTPMTTIFGGAQLIANPAVSNGTRTEAAESVIREAEHLNRIVEDLVTLVRSDRALSSDVEPFLVQHMLTRLIAADTATRAATVRLQLEERLPAVHAIEGHVEHVVRNLVHHALLYGPPGATIEVRARRVGKFIEISVADEGPGRNETDARSAFDLFHVSSRSIADVSGANLSLVVTRRLVEAMGGRIWARTSSTGGETTFTLPVAKRSQRASAPAL